MRKDRIKIVRDEMKRFKERLDDFERAVMGSSYGHPKESGAVRRASLDLTRALADLRKSDYVD